MCSWLSSEIANTQVRPNNPANIKLLVDLSRTAEKRLRALAEIASEMGYHFDADLDYAWELIQEFEEQFPAKLGETP